VLKLIPDFNRVCELTYKCSYWTGRIAKSPPVDKVTLTDYQTRRDFAVLDELSRAPFARTRGPSIILTTKPASANDRASSATRRRQRHGLIARPVIARKSKSESKAGASGTAPEPLHRRGLPRDEHANPTLRSATAEPSRLLPGHACPDTE
jgi:hypothetical protein